MRPGDSARPADGADPYERYLAIALVVGSLVFALVVQSVFFHRSNWMQGDITYHRGVAYTMVGGDIQGEGPFAGLLSYYGGLYPLAIEKLSELRGTSFDRVLGLLSWPATLLLPLAFLMVGRRLMPRQPLATAILVLLGTTAAPWTRRPDDLWVESMLPSGSSFWPMFPRDIGLVLLIVVAWSLLDHRSAVRSLGAGVAACLLILVHVQLSILAFLLIGTAAIVRVARGRTAMPIAEAGLAAAVAIVGAAWWWVPRVQALVESGGLLITDHPSRVPIRLDVAGFVTAFGAVGILAVVTAVGFAIKRDWPVAARFGAAWVLALLPLIAFDRLVEGPDLFSERRIWLVASIGLIVLAAVGATALVRSMRRPLGLAFIAVVLVAPSLPATTATIREVRAAWQPEFFLPEGVSETSWRLTTEALRDRTLAAGEPIQVVTYDSQAAWLWSFSGAQVPSLWLAGYMKLGFDPEVMTGQGYLERVRNLDAAFDAGLPGVCALARTNGLDALVLWAHEGLVGLHDRSVGSPYRVEPDERDVSSIDRYVAPAVRYRDRNRIDTLELDPGGAISIPWVDPTVARIGVVARRLTPGDGPVLRVTTGAGPTDVEVGTTRDWVWVGAAGVDGVRLEALAGVELVRVVAMAPWPRGTPPLAEGLFIVDTAEACPG